MWFLISGNTGKRGKREHHNDMEQFPSLLSLEIQFLAWSIVLLNIVLSRQLLRKRKSKNFKTTFIPSTKLVYIHLKLEYSQERGNKHAPMGMLNIKR